jgi:hypothetical protein
MKPSYCRLSVILARDSPKAILLRKGPTEWVQLIAWNTADDTFEEGQWFHGKIYERRCDLSPDGSKLIYFAAKHHQWRHNDPSYGYIWTAISKPPYYTALALWREIGTYEGGGFFEDNQTVQVNFAFSRTPHPNHIPPDHVIVKKVGEEGYFHYERELYEMRLERLGWQLVQKIESTSPYAVTHTHEIPGIWRKSNNQHVLFMKIVGFNTRKFGGSKVIEYSLQDTSAGLEIVLSNASWADWDQSGRLVYVKEGRVFSAEIHNTAVIETELADFNANKPKGIIVPDWARQWE